MRFLTGMPMITITPYGDHRRHQKKGHHFMKQFLSILGIMSLTLTSSVASCLFSCCGADDEKPAKKISSIQPQDENSTPNPLQDTNWKKKKVEQDETGVLRTKSLGTPLEPVTRSKSVAPGANTDVILQPEMDPKRKDAHQNTNE